ncbi:MAG: hypothetical protein KGL39_11100 [Patescibacteria group bacterium]|nr:hypothetical protein [Patescibacteria group bacterium]
MNIEHKIREFLRTQDEPVTAQQIGEAIGHENSNSLGTILYKMANRNQGIGRKKVKEGKRLVYGYFSTDKDAPVTAKKGETLNLSSKPVEKQEVKRDQPKAAEAAPEPKDIPPVIPEITHTPEPAPDFPGAHKPKKFFYVMGHDDYPSLEEAVAAARDIAAKNSGETIEVWETAMLHRFRAKVEVEEVS